MSIRPVQRPETDSLARVETGVERRIDGELAVLAGHRTSWSFDRCGTAGPGRAVLVQRPRVSFGVIGFIVFGLVVGAVARLLLPARQHSSIVATPIIGVDLRDGMVRSRA